LKRTAYYVVMEEPHTADELTVLRKFVERLESGHTTLRRDHVDVTKREITILKREITNLERVLARLKLEDQNE
jgi:polyhydroxyalkanoate synthesis regulator phasin